jgi:MarR family transcriptional regulator, organic hydroperoxide resistance regulator
MNIESVTYLFTTFATKHRDNLDKLMKEIGLHGGQVFVLNALWSTDGQSQAELVKQLNISAPTVYNMVTRLAETGFVEVNKDENDARIMRVHLTEKGFEIKDKVFEQWRKLELQTFTKLTEPEKMMFSMLLQKIVEK